MKISASDSPVTRDSPPPNAKEHVKVLASRRIAIVGARGVANYGGFETFVAEIGPRLVREGFEVFCSQRDPGTPLSASEFRGMKLLSFPFRFPKSSKLGRVFEILYDYYFILKCSLGLKCDTIYCLGVVSGLVLPVLRLSGTQTLVNVDGLEWQRQKFRFLERGFLKISFHACGIFADTIIIDNGQLVNHVPEGYRRKLVFIPYGVCETDCIDRGAPVNVRLREGASSTLAPKSYWLVVARLEPENSIDLMLDAYLKSESGLPLVIVGGFSSRGYESRVRTIVCDSEGPGKVLFTGPIHDKGLLTSLRCSCRAYIHGHSVGGTNPSLLEAMSAGNLIVAHDNVFNREVCGETALYFETSPGLREILVRIENHPDELQDMASEARLRASENYRWDDVTSRYVSVLRSRP